MKNICFLAVCFLFEIFLITGKGITIYLFFRRKFSWDNKGYGVYIGTFGIVGLFSQYVLLPFMSNRLKLHDMTIQIWSFCNFSTYCHHWCCYPADCHMFHSCLLPKMDYLSCQSPCNSQYVHHNCHQVTYHKGPLLYGVL